MKLNLRPYQLAALAAIMLASCEAQDMDIKKETAVIYAKHQADFPEELIGAYTRKPGTDQPTGTATIAKDRVTFKLEGIYHDIFLSEADVFVYCFDGIKIFLNDGQYISITNTVKESGAILVDFNGGVVIRMTKDVKEEPEAPAEEPEEPEAPQYN